MSNKDSPVLTSNSSHIGGHRIVREIGLIQTATEPSLIGGTWDSHVEALVDLKQVARECGANGVINIQQESSFWHGKPVRLKGIAVVVEPTGRHEGNR